MADLSLCLQLQMLGYDISWAGFNIIEVMSSTKFTHKRIGYLAASQSFHADTEVKFILHDSQINILYEFFRHIHLICIYIFVIILFLLSIFLL